MIVLHISLVEDEILLWAECAHAQTAPKPGTESKLPKNGTIPGAAGKRTRKASASRAIASKEAAEPQFAPAHHPYAASASQLLHTISNTNISAAEKRNKASVAVWLPTVDDCPVPSRAGLKDDLDSENKTCVLKPWLVDCLRLMPDQLIELMHSCKFGHVVSPGVLIGDEFSFFEKCIQFAVSLVTRQQYLPSMRSTMGSHFSVWEPVFIDEDYATLSALAAMMPHAVRAISHADRQRHVPNASRQALSANLTQLLVDNLVRSSGNAPAAEEFASVHDCWIHALQQRQSQPMHFHETALAEFAAQLHEWASPISSGQAAPFRLCFRLEEPTAPIEVELLDAAGEPVIDEDDGDGDGQVAIADEERSDEWKVTYHLQSLSDKSLLIPADEAWHGSDNARSAFAAHRFNPREFLLQSLGQAARLCDEITSGLIKNDLDGYELDNSGAVEFLSERAQALQEADFGVMLPSWWKKGRRKLRVSAHVTSSPKKKSELSLDSLVEFKWKVAIGDQSLTLEELTALAELKTPLIRIRGRWIHVSGEDIKMAIELLKKKSMSKARVADVLKLRIGALSGLGELGDVEVIAEGPVGELLKKLEEPSALEELAPPDGFTGKLRHYQQRGYSWLSYLGKWGLGACLADDMGLGKTVQTLAFIQNRRTAGDTAPVLLVCPTSVINNWQKEAGKFTPELKVLVHHGPARAKGRKFESAVKAHDVVISSYSLLHRDLEDLRTIRWSSVVIDEAQNIKNAYTKQSVAVRDISSPCRIALTGTPVENSVADLWSIMEFLNPGLLGSNQQFRKNYFYPIEVSRDAETTQKLLKITQPFVLRRVKTDKSIIDDLPEKQEIKVFCSMTREQATLYSAVTKDLETRLKSAEGIGRSGLVLATLAKLKQVCNHPAHFLADQTSLSGRSGKLIRLEEITEEILTAREKVLIFSQFKEMGSLIKQALEDKFGEEILFLHGAVSKKERDKMVDRFQSADGPSIFMLSLKAGGTGLNLTAANHVIHYDRWWNPAVENQASDRAFRIGQTKMVQVRKFICAGTLEEKIDNMIEGKAKIAAEVVGTGEGWLTNLSNDDLKQVLALSSEALADD